MDDQISHSELQSIVGHRIISARRFGGHGAEYEINFDDGRTLYITMSDYSKDLVCRLNPNED